MKRKFLLILLLILIITFSSFSLASALKIKDTEINFSIEPEEIDHNTYIPINQFKKLDNFSMYTIEEDRFLIIYKSNYYAFSLNNKEIKSNKGNFNICCTPIKINNKLLVPFDLVDKIFATNIINKDKQKRVSLELKLDQQQVIDKETLLLQMKINNNTEENIKLEFKTSQKYDILIKNKNNEIIYNWAKDKMFTQAFNYITIKANSSIKFEEKLDISDLNKGSYQLEVQIKANNIAINREEITFSIKK